MISRNYTIPCNVSIINSDGGTMKLFGDKQLNYYNPQKLEVESYRCGFCGDSVSSERGIRLGEEPDGSGGQVGGIFICPRCKGPTLIAPDGTQYPGNVFGNPVANVPEDLNTLYEEARRCMRENCFTGTVLLCRKILMNIAVEQGANEGMNFVQYVNYLSDEGHIPKNGKAWVDYIRKKGNEANHEVHLMNGTDAEDLLKLSEMLLRLVYEFSSIIPAKS
jgi:hypothetical protein